MTALTGALCRAAGLATVVAGNIGAPVLDALAGCDARTGLRWPDVFVLELSSFQLETTSSLAADAAAVLNVTENHLDRYAGMADYAAAKARIFAHGGVQVLNRDDPRSLAMRIAGRTVETFGAGVPADEGEWGLVRFDGTTWLAHGGGLLVPVDVARAGRAPQRANALAALALVSTVARIDRARARCAAALPGPAAPHAARSPRRAASRSSTTPRARTSARRGARSTASSGPVVLIAGGDGKGQDFSPLAVRRADCRAVLLIGRDAPLHRARARGHARARGARRHARRRGRPRASRWPTPGDAVLLSPACASFDMFRELRPPRRALRRAGARAPQRVRAHA